MILKQLLVYFLSALAIFFVLCFSVYPFLAKTEKIDSDVMVLEGWVSEETLDSAASEFKSSSYDLLITTGGPLPREDVIMPYSSELRFKLDNEKAGKSNDPSGYSIIEVTAQGTELDGEFAHFKVRVNDSVVGDAFTTNTAKRYLFKAKIGEGKIDSLSIIFDNDGANSNGDRNFIFKSVKLNNRIISPFNKNVAVIRKKEKKWIKERVYRYFPDRTASILEEKGIDEEKVISVPTPFVERDRTFESALSVKEFLTQNHPGVKSFNVLTDGVHSRRSWMMYKKAFGEDFKIGIVAIENRSVNSSNWWKSRKGINSVLEQFGKYIYALFWFTPFH